MPSFTLAWWRECVARHANLTIPNDNTVHRLKKCTKLRKGNNKTSTGGK